MPRCLLIHPKKIIMLSVFVFASLIYLTLSKNVASYRGPEVEEGVIRGNCSHVSPFDHPDLTPDQPVLYVVTPTYTRREQIAELTRLSQTLRLVANLVWIVSEDSRSCSPLVASILERSGLPHAHMYSPMPRKYLRELYKPRGVASRNAGVDWLLEQSDLYPGVLYFADDDNSYDVRIFEEMRGTKKVSMFPVGLIGKAGLSAPIVREGKVVGFTDDWFENRKFPVDMAGFAVHTDLVLRHRPFMPFKAGHEEDLFLRAVDLRAEEIEPLAADCTEVLVWHTKTVSSPVARVRMSGSYDENLSLLLKNMAAQGLVKISDYGQKLPVCLEEKCRTKRN